MAKPISVTDVTDLVAGLESEIQEARKKIELYEESIEKGLTGFVDLIIAREKDIRRNERLILLLKHPEVNPVLGNRFDISPKTFSRKIPRNTV